ncbi:MAG TPA: DUF721 domain-containing protein [Parafilimonas sp.]|nr:DUF721 domain-containing protein [Parafilimonas sp.]
MAQMQIGEALRDFLNKSKLKNGLRAVQIESSWEEIMGKTIARYTDKIQIINTTLFIYTSVGALRQELIYQKPKIIERINEALQEKVITDVIVK